MSQSPTFMRMKEDHMLNGQLKPGYNFQISTNNQYIVNYSLHQTTADTTTLQEHTELYKKQYQQAPDVITADAGFGSEQNYQYLSDNNIENYVKYNYFDKDQSSRPDKKYPLNQIHFITTVSRIITSARWDNKCKTSVHIKQKPKQDLYKPSIVTRLPTAMVVR